MSISRADKKKWDAMSASDRDRVVRMAWEDRTSFETIEMQFGLTPNAVVEFMRTQLDGKAYRRWRRRASEQGQLKQEAKSGIKSNRFKCSRQRTDGTTKGWK